MNTRKVKTWGAYLLVGVGLTYVTGWSLMIWSPHTSSTLPPEDHPEGDYPPFIPGPDGIEAWWCKTRGVGVLIQIPLGAKGSEGGFRYWGNNGTPAYYECGWPLLSLRSIVTAVDAPGTSTPLVRLELPKGEILCRGLQTEDLPQWVYAREDRRIPLIPKWPGFAANTAVFSLAAAALVTGMGRLRGVLRRRRGACRACGYDQRGLEASVPCPECGRQAVGP